jgi:hypothetical protein
MPDPKYMPMDDPRRFENQIDRPSPSQRQLNFPMLPYSGRRMRPPDDSDEASQRMKNTAPKFAGGGMVKAGSPKVSAPCRDTKTLKCYK